MPHADVAEAGTPLSIEGALRRVRYLACVLVAVRLMTASDLHLTAIAFLVLAFASISLLSLWAQRAPEHTRMVLGVAQLVADTAIVLVVVGAQHGPSDSADWAVLVLPVIEGAIRFQIPGAVASWLVLAGAYGLWNFESATSARGVDARPAPHRRVPRRAPERVPRRAPRRRDRGAPARAGRGGAAQRPPARGRPRRSAQHPPRRRRDPRGAPAHRRRDGIRRTPGVRAVRRRRPRAHGPTRPPVARRPRDPARRPPPARRCRRPGLGQADRCGRPATRPSPRPGATVRRLVRRPSSPRCSRCRSPRSRTRWWS